MTAGSPGGRGSGDDGRVDEAAWAEIVAGYDRPVEAKEAIWPEAENVETTTEDTDPLEPDAADPPREAGTGHGDDLPVAGDADALNTEASWDDEGHFVPPPPPPLPKLDPIAKLAWAGLFGGPAVLLVAAVLAWQLPTWALAGCVIAFVGGFVTLVARMGDRPPDDWDPGNGAVV